jgi:hypothetical protein
MTPCPKVSPSTTSHSLHVLYRVHPGNTSLLGKFSYPIGPFDSHPISKFGKLHEVFEHGFNLKGRTQCTFLIGSCINIDLLGMIHMNYGPLEGVPCLYL